MVSTLEGDLTASRRMPADAVMIATALMLGALAVPTLLAFLADERTINGANVWSKPLKFEVSLIIHLVTLALILQLMTPAVRTGRLSRALTTTTAVCALGEVLYIALQAARGRASHFNFSTTIETAMYGLMGFGALLLVVCAFIFGVMVGRNPREGLGGGLKAGPHWDLR